MSARTLQPIFDHHRGLTQADRPRFVSLRALVVISDAGVSEILSGWKAPDQSGDLGVCRTVSFWRIVVLTLSVGVAVM
jgi:hypothetical protein